MFRLLKSIFLISFLSFFFSACVFAEDITITTYYPSPSGSYSSLQADKLGVGDNNADGLWTAADVPTNAGEVWIRGSVGIGRTAPELKLHINAVSAGWPVASGTTQNYGSFRLGTNDSNGILDFGVNGGSGAWIQMTNRIDLSAVYPLILNPNGGNVGIGTTAPVGKLHIVSNAADQNAYLNIENTAAGGKRWAIVPTATTGWTSGAGKLVFLHDGEGSGSSHLTLDAATGYVGIGTASPAYTLDVTGTGRVTGAFTKGSGTFDIPHPDPKKGKDGWRLRHSFVESPSRGDNLYRWSVNVVSKTALITLPDYFKFLNENVQVWVSSDRHFGRAYGEVDAGLTKITIIADSDGAYNVLAVGTRKDKVAKEGFDPLGLEYQKK